MVKVAQPATGGLECLVATVRGRQVDGHCTVIAEHLGVAMFLISFFEIPICPKLGTKVSTSPT